MNARTTRIISKWPVGSPFSCELAKEGMSNINWVINTTKGNYVLRKVTHLRDEDLNFELKYLSYLKEHGFDYEVPSPIRTNENENFLRLNGSYFWLYELIKGEHIKELNNSELGECAKMMASYHSIIESSELDNNKGNGYIFDNVEVLENLKTDISKISKKGIRDMEDKFFVIEAAVLIPILESLGRDAHSKLPTFPLHLDMNPGNLLWKNNKLVGVLDWEHVSKLNATIIEDVSGMLYYSVNGKLDRYKLNIDRAKFFLREYRKYHDLSDDELCLIPNTLIAGSIEDFIYKYRRPAPGSTKMKLRELKSFSIVLNGVTKTRTSCRYN